MTVRDGRPLARWVADRVRQVAPPRLGYWPPAWEIVEGPSRQFLDALEAWQRTGADEAMREAQDAGAAVVAAWRAAAERWRAAGAPETRLTRREGGVHAGR